MAEVAEMPVEAKNTTESEPKRKRQSTLPKPTAKTLTPEAFYAYTKALTVTDWPHVLIYILRLWPRIVREPKYIDKLASPVSEEYLLTHHGSGKYWIMLNDTDNDQTVCQTYPDLDSPDSPPLLDLRELDVTHDKNRTFVDHLKRTGKLTMDGEVVQPGRDNGNLEATGITQIALEAMRMNREQKPGMENLAFGKMMDMMSNASTKSIEIALSHAKKDDPGGFMTLMVQMMQAQQTTLTALLTKLLDGNGNKGSDPVIGVLMKQMELAEKRAELAESRAADERKSAEAEKQRAHEKEMKALEMRGDPMEMIDKVLNIKDRLTDDPEPKNWKEKLVDQGFSALPDILNAVKGYTQRAAPPQQQPRANQPVQQQPAPTPPTQTTAQATTTQEPPMPLQPALDPDIAFLLAIFEAQGRQFVAAFVNDPFSGGDVARTVSLFADGYLHNLRASHHRGSRRTDGFPAG